jgi:hypothetical protein
MKRIVFISVISIIFPLNIFCQVGGTGPSLILFHGVVIDAASLSKLTGYEILINRSHSAFGTENGYFSFYAYKKDTIVFILQGYKPQSIILSDTLAGKDFLTGVYLVSDTTDIGEVIILPRMANLKAELLNARVTPDPKLENAVANINTASYVGRTTTGKLGDPVSNYEYLRQKSKVEAYEKGGIPSDRLIGFNPFILIPAAYMLLHGRPETPPPPKPQITSKDMEELKSMYIESLKSRKK